MSPVVTQRPQLSGRGQAIHRPSLRRCSGRRFDLALPLLTMLTSTPQNCALCSRHSSFIVIAGDAVELAGHDRPLELRPQRNEVDVGSRQTFCQPFARLIGFELHRRQLTRDDVAPIVSSSTLHLRSTPVRSNRLSLISSDGA